MPGAIAVPIAAPSFASPKLPARPAVDCTTLRVSPEAAAGRRVSPATAAPAYGIPRPPARRARPQPARRPGRAPPALPPPRGAAPPPFGAGLPSGPRMAPGAGLGVGAPPPGMEPTIRVPTRIVATVLEALPNPPPGALGALPRPRHHEPPRPTQLAALAAPYAATSAATPISIFGRCVTRAIVAGRQSVISGPPMSRWPISCATSIAAAGVSACRLHAGSRFDHNSSRDKLMAGWTCAPRAWPFCPTRPARAPSVSWVPKGVPLSAAMFPPTDATSRLATSIGLAPGSTWPI